MGQIIDVQDVTVYMSRSYAAGSASATAAAEIIDGLEGDLEAYLKRALVEDDVEDELVEPDRRGVLRLARTPVISVDSVTIDGTVQVSTSYRVKSWGVTDLFVPFLPSPLISPEPVVLVSYRGGLPGADASTAFGRKARATLLRAAARDITQVVLEKAPGVARLNVEGTAIDFHGGVKAGAGGLTEDERKQFDRWRRRVVRT